MGKAITTLVVLALVIAGAIWIFNRDGMDLVRDGNTNDTTTEDMTGTGGPEEGFNPLDGDNSADDGEDALDQQDKG